MIFLEESLRSPLLLKESHIKNPQDSSISLLIKDSELLPQAPKPLSMALSI